jgi:hypothetical protein
VTNQPLMYPDPGEPVSAVPYTPAPDTRGWLDIAIDATVAWLTNPDNTMTAVAVILGALVLTNLLRRSRRNTDSTTSSSAEDITTADRVITRITGLIATAVLAQGMWVFFTEVIRIHWAMRVVLFAFIEVQLIAALRRTRRYLYRHGNLGSGPWTIAGLAATTATLAAVHAASLDDRLFRLLAAAVAAHMVIEELREERDILRHRNPNKYPPLEKWTVKLRNAAAFIGLAEPTTLAVSEVATQRRIDRLSRLLDRFHAATADTNPGRVKKWYTAFLGRQVVRKTQAACKYINLAEDPAVRGMLLRRLGVVRGIVEATKPGAVAGDAWADVTQIETGDVDQRHHIIDVEPTQTQTTDATADAPRQTPTVTVNPTQTPTHAVTTPTPTQPTDAATPAVTVTGVTVRRTKTDVAVVRPLSRDLIDERFRDWTVDQVRDYAAKKARQVVDGGGTKKDGMKVFLLLCMALGVDPAGTWMAEAVEGAQSAARTNKPEWLAELAVADAEQILLAEHRRIVTELTDGGDVRG